MPTHPFAIKLAEALEHAKRIRDGMNKLGDLPVSKPQLPQARPHRRPPIDAATIRQLGSNQPLDLEVVQGETRDPDFKGSGPDGCPKPSNSTRAEQYNYLKCRCSKGDQAACRAANAAKPPGY